MNKLVKLVIAASAVLVTFSAQAYDDIKAKTPYSAYVQDSRGVIARDPFGLCWRTGYWTPADAVAGCDAPLTCPEGQEGTPPNCKTPPPPPPPPAPVAPAPVAKECPKPTSEKVTFAADALFDFDKSVVKTEGKEKLDDLVSKLKGMNLEVIIAVGHTDGIGSDAYNQKLSVKRAEAVKSYLLSKGIEANRVYTEGKGKKQPVADNKTDAGRAKNRRVEIEVVGTRMVNPDPSCKQ
ncbi:MAG: OmpA family protein [Burkholderiaceae bacterium]|nr:OmpA family protein [Burkholderiaceae bacterium]